MALIYCVEDDRSIRELVLYTLKISGFEVLGLEDGRHMEETLEKQLPDLIILDIMLPDVSGLDLLKKLRADSRTMDIPVIMATAKGSEIDKVMGLDLGADDYLAKPFGMMEMVSRIKAVLRRRQPRKEDSLRFEKITLSRQRQEAFYGKEKLELTHKEFELLAFLMENAGHVYTREQLLEHIWDANYLGESRTVDMHIASLRSKLKEGAKYIQTVRNVGYCLKEV